ncbi:hypothetical protein [Streptosporangium vulgare]|uniref:Uncharacterized protein n=1 Tax=Streptosporangium vulgare TaxID=46190 RepID=A0ABV5TRI4_9ACTN
MSWQDLTKSWQDTSVDYCDVCGNLLIHTYWRFTDGDATLRACRQGDEALWYRLKRLRADYPPIDRTLPAGLAAARDARE